MRRLLPVISLLALAHPGPSVAAISWDVEYVDQGTGTGFDGATALGAARQAAVDAALRYVGSVVDGSGTASLRVESGALPGNRLAEGRPNFDGIFGSRIDNGRVFHEIHADDRNDPAGELTFDLSKPWNNDYTAATFSGFDLFSLALHEVTHVLGINTLISSNGTSSIIAGSHVYTVWDSLLGNTTAGDLFTSTAPGSVAFDPGQVGLLSGGLIFFRGEQAVAQFGGPVPVYTPGPFSPGESLFHVADSGVDSIMRRNFDQGEARREYTELDLAMLQDLGYTLRAVPLPAALPLFAAVLLALGLIGARTARRAS